MIVNLINTILIACGMAVNTTNFNSVEKPPRKNEITTIQFRIDKGYDLKQTYTRQISTNVSEIAKKRTIKDSVETELYTDYMLINNTTYEFTLNNINNNGNNEVDIYNILEIYNYFNSQITITIAIDTTPITTSYQLNYYKWIRSYENVSENINMTLNNTTHSALESKFNTTHETLYSNQETISSLDDETTQTIQLVQYNIPAQGRLNLIFRNYMNYIIAEGNTNWQNVETLAFQINGQVTVNVTNNEIIDVPGLMLTVLTLPFSFISQAFNLTIFPGTPYQINFTNLFRTIIAIFILLWIIKKIFK